MIAEANNLETLGFDHRGACSVGALGLLHRRLAPGRLRVGLVAWARRGPRLAQVDELRDEPPRAHDDRPYAGFEIWPSA